MAFDRWRRAEASGNSVYIPHGLLFRPATESELRLYRSALAYGRGDIPTTQRRLNRALEDEPELSGPRGRSGVALLESVARQASAVDRPEEYVELVFANLPEGAVRFRTLKRRLYARLAMSRFFEANAQGDWSGVVCAGVSSIWQDPSWLGNRGVGSIFLQALLRWVWTGLPKGARRES